MRLRLLASFLALAGCAAPVEIPSPAPPSVMAHKSDPYYPYSSVGTVAVPSLGWYGSGTLIERLPDGRCLVLTNQHVVKEAGRKVKLHFPAAGDTVQGVVVAADARIDAALVLCGPLPDTYPVKVALPQKSDYGYVNVGFPSYGREHPEIQAGRLRSVYSDAEFTYWARPFPGMSGGATFNSRGELVGVVRAYTPEYGISVGGPDLLRFIQNPRVPRASDQRW